MDEAVLLLIREEHRLLSIYEKCKETFLSVAQKFNHGDYIDLSLHTHEPITRTEFDACLKFFQEAKLKLLVFEDLINVVLPPEERSDFESLAPYVDSTVTCDIIEGNVNALDWNPICCTYSIWVGNNRVNTPQQMDLSTYRSIYDKALVRQIFSSMLADQRSENYGDDEIFQNIVRRFRETKNHEKNSEIQYVKKNNSNLNKENVTE